MNTLQILILAVVQGLTEFLPVSSSGHLVVANAVLERFGFGKVPDLVEVNVVLHLGTLLAVLVYYRAEILRLMTTDRRVIPLLIVGTIPAGLAGVYLKKLAPTETQRLILAEPLVAGFCFPVTALILILVARRAAGSGDYKELGYGKAIAIGLAQAFALLPGISRSGSTIAAGLAAGLDRRAAATFAFLLAIPAIGGAGLLETVELLEKGASTSIENLALGFGVSFAVGLGSLSLLIRFVERGRLAWFAWYLVPLGVAVVIWQLAGW